MRLQSSWVAWSREDEGQLSRLRGVLRKLKRDHLINYCSYGYIILMHTKKDEGGFFQLKRAAGNDGWCRPVVRSGCSNHVPIELPQDAAESRQVADRMDRNQFHGPRTGLAHHWAQGTADENNNFVNEKFKKDCELKVSCLLWEVTKMWSQPRK